MKTYVTFGQAHTHNVGGVVLNKDVVGVVEADSFKAACDVVEATFGQEYCFSYPEEHWSESKMKFFPDGYVHLSLC